MAATLGSVPLTVSLTVGTVTGEIGSIPITVRSGRSVVLDREALVQVSFDGIRSDLAGLLRAAADEIEHPSSSEDDEADEPVEDIVRAFEQGEKHITSPPARCGNHAPWPSIPARGCVHPAGHTGRHRSPGGVEWNWST